MKKFMVLSGLILVLMMGTMGVAQAIINGQPDGNDHPFVGLVVGRTDVFVPACSGSLLSEWVFLTAAHCFDGNIEEGGTVYVTFDPDPGNTSSKKGPKFYSGEWHQHPDFCRQCGNGAPNFLKNDVGIVLLDRPVHMSEYAVLPTEGFVDTLANGTSVKLIGYGDREFTSGDGEPPQPDPDATFTRFVADANLIPSNNSTSDNFIKVSQNNGQDKGGFCFGDSGGPDLWEETNIVLAVNSWVLDGPKCDGVGYSFRVDTPNTLDYINQFLD